MTQEQEVQHWKNMVRLYKFDNLTGLKQRHDFEIETMHKMANQVFWLVMVDVNGLHVINRDVGFQAGDALIKQVGYDLQQADGAWEVYRIGGDEFMALFFYEPIDLNIDNSTSSYVYSGDFNHFTDMFNEVDRMVIKEKNKLKRRKEDERDR